jgi:hypothetical protein
MKRDWTSEELTEHFSLSAEERLWLAGREEHSSLALAVQLKCFQYLGYFVETPQEIPAMIIEELARQLGLSAELWLNYDWQGRSAERHRAAIRERLGFRASSLEDAEKLVAWLEAQLDFHQEDELAQVTERAYRWLRQQHLEPPSPQRLERLLHRALRNF